MKRITLFFLLFFTQIIFAQFAPSDVKFHVGTGTETAYLVVDFKDGTDDRSYAWGYHYTPGTGQTFASMLVAIAAAEPNFTINPTSGGPFLNHITFNDHTSVGGSDWWSTWSGTSAQTFGMNGGVSEALTNGHWYGVSYGFSNPTSQAPVEPIAAYSSQWYKNTDIVTWLGTGANESLVVVDFGTDTNNVADSYVFGIKYNGTITAEDALDLINTELNGFDYVMTANVLSSVTIGTRTETASGTNVWKAYSGTDLSSWKTEADLSTVSLAANDWLGLSIGSRRPFKPQDITATLSSKEFNTIQASVYPNPTTDVLNIETTESISNVIVYNIAGQKVLQANTQTLNVSTLQAGVYVLKIETENGIATSKFVKK